MVTNALVVTYTDVEQVVQESGLWHGTGENYRFLPSPAVYTLTGEQRKELEKLGVALRESLGGLGRIFAIASQSQFAYGKTWGMVLRSLRTGVPKNYHHLACLHAGRTPAICKVDLMEGVDGRFYIAEIDGHNKHGLGYSTLGARCRRLIAPDAQTFPGVANVIAVETKRLNRGVGDLVLLYADQERFYLPEFRILREELKHHGVELTVVAESELELGRIEGRKYFKKHPLFVDLPFMYHNKTLNELLAEGYVQGEVDFLLPPKPFFGSKAILALLRNDEEKPELEAVLRSQIPLGALALVREYLPETYLVHKGEKRERWAKLADGRRFVLKETVSSGMKGTVFPEDDGYEKTFNDACASYYRFVFQEEVHPKRQRFAYFDDRQQLAEADWYTRVTVHFTRREVADIIVTARRDKKVHGAPDCLQLGTVIEG